jgi:hypothetical protein
MVETREGEGISPAWLGFRRGELWMVDAGDDAVLLGTSGGDDGAQRTTASSMVVVASSNRLRGLAKDRLEPAVLAGSRGKIRRARRAIAVGFWGKERREGGGYK